MFKKFKKKNQSIHAFGSGTVKSLSSVPDEVFAKKMMGDGYALELSEGSIYAPVSGELTAVFPTGHAFGIKTKAGIEVLIHIGIDTVELGGEGFDVKVKQGQKVNQGDLLVEVDLDYLRSQNKPTITPMILTSGESIKLLLEDQVVSKDNTNIFEII